MRTSGVYHGGVNCIPFNVLDYIHSWGRSCTCRGSLQQKWYHKVGCQSHQLAQGNHVSPYFDWIKKKYVEDPLSEGLEWYQSRTWYGHHHWQGKAVSYNALPTNW